MDVGIWTDLAEWRGPTPNQSGHMIEQRGLVVHIAEGYYEGTIAWQKNPAADVSSHFVVAGPRDSGGIDGRLGQVVDTDVTAWTQRAGNGHWGSIECSGFVPDRLSDKQMKSISRVFARYHTTYGVPLQVANDPNGRGLGHHSMGCNWPGGAWGHCDCPGNNIIAQKPTIVSLAIQIVMGVKNVDILVRDGVGGPLWHSNGMLRRKVKEPAWTGSSFNGPITNSQVHQTGLLGNLQTGPAGSGQQGTWESNGQVYVSGGDMDVWGIDVATLGGGAGGLVDHTHSGVSVTVSGTGSGSTGGAIPA